MRAALIFISTLYTIIVIGQQNLSTKQVIFLEKNNISITNYKFDNDVANKNIQRALKYEKNQKILGLISIPVSIGWLGYTAYIPAKKFIDNRKSDVLIPTTTNNTYFIISSSLFTAASSCLIATLLQKEKRNKSLKLIKL